MSEQQVSGAPGGRLDSGPGGVCSPRKNELFERNYGPNGERGKAVRAMGCYVRGSVSQHPKACKCYGPMNAAHVVARGAGGVHGDAGSLVCLCFGHHEQQSRVGVATFDAVYGCHLVAYAATVRVDLDGQFGPLACYKCGGIGGHSPMCKTMEAVRERREDEL